MFLLYPSGRLVIHLRSVFSKFEATEQGFRMITGDPMVRSDRHVVPNSVQSYALSFRCYDGVPGSDWAYAPGVGPFESVGLPKSKCPGGIRTNIFFPTWAFTFVFWLVNANPL